MTQAIVGGLLTFLLGCCLVMLVAIYRVLCRGASRAHVAAEQQAEETRKHRDATAAIVVDNVRDVGRAIVRELQRGAKERREAVSQLMGMEADRDPPASFGAPTSSAPPTSRPRAVVKAGVCTLPPDAPTPRSGYPVSDWLAAEPAEREGEAR